MAQYQQNFRVKKGLVVNEAATISGNAAISGNVTTTGTASFSNTVVVTGAATFSNTVGVTGATTLSSTLNVTGAASFSNTASYTGAATFSNTVGITGATTLSSTANIVGAATFSNTVGITGATTLSNTLGVTGAATLSNTISVTGTATFSNTTSHVGAAAFSNTVAVTGAATFSNTVGVTGVASFGNNVTISGNLTVTGVTTYVNTSVMNIADNIVTLNADVTGAPSENAGIEINRGTSANSYIRWNETTDVWEATGNTGISGAIAEVHVGGTGAANVAVDNSNGTVLQDITVGMDKFGHVTAISTASANLDVRYDARYLGFQNVAVRDVIATLVANTTLNSNIVAAAGSGSVAIGYTVRSPYFPWGTSVNSANATHFITSANATATVTGATIEIASGLSTIVADLYNDTMTIVANGAIVLYSDATNDEITFGTAAANTTFAGVVQLLDSVSNTNIAGYAPTANSVKNAYDRAIDANTRAASAQTAATSAYSNATSFSANGSNITNGTVSVTVGGTGLTSYAAGDLLIASNSTSLAKLADVAVGNVLLSGGVSANPSYGKVDLTTHIANTLPVGNGGTGLTSYTAGDILFASNGTTIGKLADVAVGNVLLSGGVSANPSYGKVDLTTHIANTLPVGNGGTGAATLSGVVYGNGANAFTAATGSQIATAIGATYVTNAGYATNAGTSTYVSGTQQTSIIIGKSQSMSMSQNGTADGSFTCRAGGTGDGNLAGMIFHNDSYAIKLGIRADGYFGLGGWSRAAWSWYSDPSGNMVAAGNVSAYSDPRLKENFKRIESPLSIIDKLDGGTFNWKQGIAHVAVKAGQRDYGVLADQVEAVMPEIVTDSIEIDGEKYKTVSYEKIVPVLIEAIKELKAEIDVLKQTRAS